MAAQCLQTRPTKPEIPCAACRLLHRKCVQGCTLAPYFPADEPEKFASVHKVFGASNVTKMLQVVEEGRREDAVKSMVYEAFARIRDPVHGCTGAIFYLQKCVEDLAIQLKTTQEQVIKSHEEMQQLLSILMDENALEWSPSNSASKEYLVMPMSMRWCHHRPLNQHSIRYSLAPKKYL